MMNDECGMMNMKKDEQPREVLSVIILIFGFEL